MAVDDKRRKSTMDMFASEIWNLLLQQIAGRF